MKLTRPTCILFDLDNTVYAYEPCHVAGIMAAQRLAATLDPRWSTATEFARDYAQARQVVKRQVGPQSAGHCRLLYFKNMVEAQFGRTDIEATRRLHEAYWGGYFSKMTPDPGCMELLHDLRASSVRLAWVSNYTTERQMLKLRALGLEQAADFLITSEEVGVEKPNSTVLDHALARLKAGPEEAWMVGDDLEEDIGAARVLGLTAVWFRRQDGTGGSEVPNFTVSNWFELRELLDRERNH